MTTTEQNILKEHLCKVCQKYPENNCDECRKLKLGYQLAQKETAEKVEKLKEELFYGDYLHFNNAEKKVISNVFNKIFNEDKK
jgi:hypothetical protein